MKPGVDPVSAEVGLEEVLLTAELSRRPARPPDFEAENRALGALAQEMATSPGTVLQKLVKLTLELCRADSAGISILEPGGRSGVFRWHAAAGAFAGHLGGTTPRDASPSGTVMARNTVLLFDRAERHFPALREIQPPIFEKLLVPFHLNGQPIGTVWAIGHRPERQFDAEDARLLSSLARFASAAYQLIQAREAAETGRRELEQRVQERTAALRESEERLRLIFDSAHDFAIFTVDVQSVITGWNRGAEAIFGYTAAEAAGQGGDLIFTPEDRAARQPQREIETARHEGRAADERWHVRKDGGRFWGSGVLTPMLGPEGQVTGFLKILRDLTVVHRAEQARRQAEERFRLLARAVRDYAIFLLDPQGRITHWNEGAARLKGYSEAEVLGRHISLFYTPEQIAAGTPERQLQEAATQGRSHEEDWRVRKGGERFWGDELVVPLRDEESGALLGFAKICQDLSERKAAEDERARLLAAEQAARRQAEAADRAKDRFLAALSHELRTPLTPVQMALFSLQHEEQLSATGREAVAMIGRNLEMERQLIDDLLDVSRIVHGKLEVRPEPVDLHGCVRAALEVCRSNLAAKDLNVTVELDATNSTVLGDEARLQQVFWNLLQNAAKFTPEGGVVTVRSRGLADQGVAVEVADTGVGIAPELLPKLFNPFEQGGTEVARRHGGLGLGLAISQAIIQAHGGRLQAASPGPGQGATFTVDLPAWLQGTADGETASHGSKFRR